MQNLKLNLIELIRRTSSDLPDDVQKTILAGLKKEAKKSLAEQTLLIIQKNIQMAETKSQPICQDTGSILFFSRAPIGFDVLKFEAETRKAVADSTRMGYLRQNSVDSLTGHNSGNNLGPGTPAFHYEFWRKPQVDVRLVLKGGGCENVGAQYSLPHSGLNANRDLDGCRKVILDAVLQAQGKGCGPGILGICIGGDRTTGSIHAKEQFLRKMNDRNPNPELDRLELDIVNTSNRLGIGPMGFGGTTTLLGCKIGVLNRLPASYFVTISYMCWAYRRQGFVLNTRGKIVRWLY
jgi:fumarate hydratase class I